VLAISIFPLIYSLTTSFLSYRLIPPDFRAQNLDRRAMQHRSLPMSVEASVSDLA